MTEEESEIVLSPKATQAFKKERGPVLKGFPISIPYFRMEYDLTYEEAKNVYYALANMYTQHISKFPELNPDTTPGTCKEQSPTIV